MDMVTVDLQTPHPLKLLYAIDVMLVKEAHMALQLKAQEWKDLLGEQGIRLNITKMEYLEYLAKATQPKYLGLLVTSDSDTILDTRAQFNVALLNWR